MTVPGHVPFPLVVEHVTARGGEAPYKCSPTNHASVATARSAGFVPYARGLVFSVPAPNKVGE